LFGVLSFVGVCISFFVIGVVMALFSRRKRVSGTRPI
jgi:hypothetical protein